MTDITQTEWQAFVASRPEANLSQSAQWGTANQLVGHKIVRGGVRREGTLVAGWQGIVKDARRGRYLEVPGGPLLDWTDDTLAQEVIAQLKTTGHAHQCVFVRLRPQVVDSSDMRQCLARLRLRRAPFYLHAEHTNILSLTKSEDELLAGMRRQTRYEVRQAAKKGIVVSHSSGEAAADEFFAVQAETAQRQGFVPSSRQVLRAQLRAFGENARVYRAEKDGVLLNLALILFAGEEADYFEAASTPESRGYPGAYAVQWQAIRDAKAIGKTRYNFWGTAPGNDPKHRFGGVTTFKRGFGGDDVAYVPAHDLALRPTYLVAWLIETIRKKRRKL